MQITNTLLGLSALLLGISLLVQVVQELYKYLTSSKSIVYRQVLLDSIGPIAGRLYEAGPATPFHVRRPLQWFRSRPTGTVLPMEKDTLLSALDAQVPDWAGFALRALKDEVRIQNGKPAAPSERLAGVVREATAAGEVSGTVSNRAEVGDFLAKRVSPANANLDARRILEEFYLEFTPERLRADEEFEQIQENYRYAYVRRNTRQTLVLGLLLAIVVGFPFSDLWETAKRLSPEEASDAAVAMREAYDRLHVQGTSAAGQAMDEAAKTAKQLAAEFEKIRLALPGDVKYDGWKRLWGMKWGEKFAYLGNCLVTAILLCFGAPFWHRLTGALLRVSTPKPAAAPSEA